MGKVKQQLMAETMDDQAMPDELDKVLENSGILISKYPAIKQDLLAWRDEEMRRIKETRVKQNQSFCGCPMCQHHSEAYQLEGKKAAQ